MWDFLSEKDMAEDILPINLSHCSEAVIRGLLTTCSTFSDISFEEIKSVEEGFI